MDTRFKEKGELLPRMLPKRGALQRRWVCVRTAISGVSKATRRVVVRGVGVTF